MTVVRPADVLIGVCAGALFWAAAITAFERLAMARRSGAPHRSLIAGVVVGAGVWAHQFLCAMPCSAAFDAGFAPLGALISLIVSVTGAVGGFVIAERYRDARGVLTGGAILGAAIASAQTIALLSMHVSAQIAWDDSFVGGGIWLASAFSVVAIYVVGRLPDIRGRVLAASVLTLGVIASRCALSHALTLTDAGWFSPDDAATPAHQMALIAGLVLALVVLKARRPLETPAPRARARRSDLATVLSTRRY